MSAGETDGHTDGLFTGRSEIMPGVAGTADQAAMHYITHPRYTVLG